MEQAITGEAEYIQETGESTWQNGTSAETYEYQYNFDSNGNFLGGFEISNGIKTTWGANWVNLGQSSTLDIAQEVADGTVGYSEVADAEFAGLPASFKAASGKTYVKVDDFGNGNSESTYYDSTGKVLGYANTNTFTYTDTSNNSVTNSNINFSSANWGAPWRQLDR